jgi:endonuclease/exonuclease/phosphatase family metal-dependent hydrolase
MIRKAVLLLLGLWVAFAAKAAGGPPVDLSLFTANCYCFDESQTKVLKDLTWLGNKITGGRVDVKDLQSGIQKNTGTRRREIAQNIVASKADFVFLQELWNGKNKSDMVDLLSKDYKYYYMASNIKRGAAETDDGLLMFSKWPPFFTTGQEFEDKYDDETHAHKGFLIMGIYHPSGGFILLVNTHLQSGTDDKSCSIRLNQIGQLVGRIRELARLDWRIQNATILTGGDTNDPITVDLSRPVDQWATRPLPADNSSQLRFNGNPANWSYFSKATEPSGRQMLDQLFLDPTKATLLSITVMRQEFMGDPGFAVHKGDPKQTYNPVPAISDHAGVLFRFRLAPSL